MRTKTPSAPSNLFSVLMIAPQYRPLVGGYERAAERLAGALVERNLEVAVITERRNKQWPANESQHGVSIVRLWCIYRPKLHIVTAMISFALFLALHGRRYQVWHVHQYGQHATLAVALGKIFRIPVVLKLTSSGDQGLQHTITTGRFAALSKALLSRVAAVVTLTRETTREAELFGIPKAQIHQLGNGVDTTAYRPRSAAERAQIKQALGLGQQRLAVYVGRLSQEKNPDGLLAAWLQALPSMPDDWRLVIVGDGPMWNTLELVAQRENIKNTISMVGLQHNVDQWLAAADIYLSTSHREGLSNTMLEAMATGLPVITTRVSGVSELVEEPNAGMIVEVGDMHGFANALVKLAGDTGLTREMGATARHVIEIGYSITAVAAKHEALYSSLVNKK